MGELVSLPERHWAPEADEALSRGFAAPLEAGKVVHLPRLAYRLRPEQLRFLDTRWSDGRAKNISFDPASGAVAGAIGNRSDLEDLARLLRDFHETAVGFIERVLPAYRGRLRAARASLRPFPVSGRASSWRKDDSRLHVDAFPSRPNQGERILRVFCNVNPAGIERVWRVGEPFPALVRRFWPRLHRPLPGIASLQSLLRITKSRRSAYDHYMLQLHDAMKADAGYQKDAPQEPARFAPGCTWICFSDQTSHAAMEGQHMLEQTLHLPVEAMYDAAQSPLRVMEAVAGRALA